MIYVDPEQAERITTVVCILAVCVAWVAFGFAAWLNDGFEAARREYDEDKAAREACIGYRTVGDEREQVRTLTRIDAAMAEMDEPDERERERYVG